LIGEAAVKFASGHQALLPAEAIAALDGGLPACNASSATATLRFDGRSYNALPRVLALSNFGSRRDGNDTFLLLTRIGGDLTGTADPLGRVFILLYDDAEDVFSGSAGANAPQLRINLRGSFPGNSFRFFDVIIPSGRSGWLRLWSVQDEAVLGAAFNFNSINSALSHGHNLHELQLTAAAGLTIPVFPPSC
jgi:hypothetical protein